MWSALQLVAVQPHTPGVPPPPHDCGAVHEPQSIFPPQPSSAEPQLLLPHATVFVLAVHPHAPTVPAPPHVSGATQVVTSLHPVRVALHVCTMLPLQRLSPALQATQVVPGRLAVHSAALAQVASET